MKNYFCKYLPVDEKAKPGDTCLDKQSGEIFIMGNSLNTFPEGDLKEQILENAQKVKLFLCSRALQVNDECYHIKYPEIGKWAIKEGGIKDCVDWHGENVDESNLYKVIGEISPEATWVKEGDEFDEYEEWWFRQGKAFCKFLPEGVVNWEKANKNLKRALKVKGPCGHFH